MIWGYETSIRHKSLTLAIDVWLIGKEFRFIFFLSLLLSPIETATTEFQSRYGRFLSPFLPLQFFGMRRAFLFTPFCATTAGGAAAVSYLMDFGLNRSGPANRF